MTLVHALPNQELSPHFGGAIDKVKKYKWITKDEPGEFQWIDKGLLCIDRAYQRDAASMKVGEIASEWSWIALGCISVVARPKESDGAAASYVVIDGQHRVIASWNRSDITRLPCMVFPSGGIQQEASAFVACNTNRKPVAAFDKYKANLIAGDKLATFVNEIITLNGYTVKVDGNCAKTVTCISTCLRFARLYPKHFPVIFAVAAALADKDETNIANILICGLTSMHLCGIEGGLQNPRLLARLESLGASVLIESARKMSYRLGKGGEAVWRDGMLDLVNRGLKAKFAAARGR